MKKFMRQILHLVVLTLLGCGMEQLGAAGRAVGEVAEIAEEQFENEEGRVAAQAAEEQAAELAAKKQAAELAERQAARPKAPAVKPSLPKTPPPGSSLEQRVAYLEAAAKEEKPAPLKLPETGEGEAEPREPVTKKASGEVKPAKKLEPAGKGKAVEAGGEGANEVAEQLGADIEKLRAKLEELKAKRAALKEAGQSTFDIDLEIIGVKSQIAGKSSLKTAAIAGGVAVTGLATVETGVNLYKDLNPDKNQPQVIIEQPIEIQEGGRTTTDGTSQTTTPAQTTDGKPKTKKPKKGKTKHPNKRQRELERQIEEEQGYVTPKKKPAPKKTPAKPVTKAKPKQQPVVDDVSYEEASDE